MPERIQLRRARGWSKPEDAVVVSRPSKWGNPYRIRRCDNDSDAWAIVEPDGTPAGVEIDYAADKDEARAGAVDAFRYERGNTTYPSDDEIRAELHGKNLCCWCALDAPCHGDVLLEIANSVEGADK